MTDLSNVLINVMIAETVSLIPFDNLVKDHTDNGRI